MVRIDAMIPATGIPVVVWLRGFADRSPSEFVPEKITSAPEDFTGRPDADPDEKSKNREKRRNIGDSGRKSHNGKDWHGS
jgi:hypothetical protein